jgi:putative flippase GtrA
VAAAQLVDLARTRGRKPILYSLVSVIAVIVGQSVLIVCAAVLHWDPVPSNVTSVAIGSIPSYVLNRYWVWGKRGKNHLWKEVVPFWGMAFLGLLLSTVTVAIATDWKDETWVLSLANLAAFGVIWVGKFFVLHRLLFRHAEVTTDGDQPGVVIPG